MQIKRKPLIISPIPSSDIGPIARPLAVKRLARLRTNWFLMGSVFGVGMSFFLNYLISSAVMPGQNAPQPQKPPVPITVNEATSTPPAAIKSEKPAATEYPKKLDLKLSKGQTIADMLVAQRVPTEEAKRVVAALTPKLNAQKLKAGQRISVTLARHETVGDWAAVRELAIRLPSLDVIELERQANGAFNVAAKKEILETKPYRAFGKVRTSLLQAAHDGGIPSSVMNELLKAYSYDIDFQREIHPGDTIEVLLERKATKDGQVGGYGPPRYAVLTLRGKKHEIFKFKNTYGEYAWFDAKGNSIKKSLLRTPLSVAHISSGFGMRTHPIMGYSRMHKGVDFSAPTGTPIMAAGDGTVAFKGWKGGYGNFVLIRHNKTYETAYAHMSRFANISEGNRVKQGQVIGYVGSTGASTGAHLHYEVRQNEEQVNPVSKQFNLANGLTGKQLEAFKTAKQSAANAVAALAAGKEVASLASLDGPSAAAKPAKGKASAGSKKAKPTAKKPSAKPQKLARR